VTEVLGSESALRAEDLGGRPGRQAPAGLKRMLSGASLVLGGSLVGQAANFAFNSVGAHALGPARYSVLAASIALFSFAAPFLTAVQAVASREATSLAARKELWKVPPMLRHYGLRVIGGSLVLGGAAAAASSWISGVFRLGSPWIVVLVGATIPCYTAVHLLGGLLQGTERFAGFALESVVEGLTKAVIGILAMGLLWHSALAGVAAVSASRVAGLITYLLLTLPLLRRGASRPRAAAGAVTAAAAAITASARSRGARRRAARGGVPGTVRYSMSALVTYSLLAMMLSSDTLVAKHYLSGHQAGLYAGVSLTGKIAYFAASSCFVVAFPVFSRHHDHGMRGRRWILAAGGAVGVTAGAVATLFALEPAWVVIPLLGDRYRSAEGHVPWMAAIFGLYALGFLTSMYLLARKRRGIIAVLAVALIVQFAGFYCFHSTITRMMGVLAAAFGVMLGGGVLLVLLGGRREAGRAGRPRLSTRIPAGPRAASDEQIVSEVTRHVGAVPVLLAGSRALGTAHAGSDYDVSVVLPLPRIPRAARRLDRAAASLSAALGARVSVNAVPAFRLRRPGGSLFVRKLRAEGIVLAAPDGWSLRDEPLTGVTTFAAGSMLLSAAASLLEAFDPAAMRGRPGPARAPDALRKAALLVAQVRLLRSGRYASGLEEALARLRTLPDSGSGGTGGAGGAEVAAALTAGLTAVGTVEGFLHLRACIFAQLADIGNAPFRLPVAKSVVRNAQYAALARLRGRSRWRVALRWHPVEAALAATQLELLRALDPGSADGVDAAHFRLAGQACPVPPGAAGWPSWERLRDVALAEWLDAHPLAGVLA
jgi:O-antigen/teichoic acid export membrane protein